MRDIGKPAGRNIARRRLRLGGKKMERGKERSKCGGRVRNSEM